MTSFSFLGQIFVFLFKCEVSLSSFLFSFFAALISGAAHTPWPVSLLFTFQLRSHMLLLLIMFICFSLFQFNWVNRLSLFSSALTLGPANHVSSQQFWSAIEGSV
uniref:Uncharacterized protein n=1 Tax=Opuntia streptacantha TaxID=393608 RepID=A0A7C8YYY5_OPUST